MTKGSKLNDSIVGGMPVCMNCEHMLEIGLLDGTGWTCKAFPKEIPPSILKGITDHIASSYNGDKNLRWRPRYKVRVERGLAYWYELDKPANTAPYPVSDEEGWYIVTPSGVLERKFPLKRKGG